MTPHETLIQHKQHAIAQYRRNRRPFQFFRAYTHALDTLLQHMWHEHFGDTSPLCLLALGGYGRSEMYPHSDIDLAIVSPTDLSANEQQNIEQFVHILWDTQLAPAVKSGSLKDLATAAREDLSADTALLEARFIAGNTDFAQHALHIFRLQRDTVTFMESKLLEMQQRHAKQPSLTLEPNIKNCIGGLRDLHTIGWLVRAQNLYPDLNALIHNQVITPTEAHLLRRSHRQLAQLRIELHLAAHREEDRLIFDLQGNIAETNGWCQPNKQAGIERLMHNFYRAAKTVMQLNGILIPMLQGRVYSPLSRIRHEIDADYFQDGNQIAAYDLQLFARQPENLFRIIELWQNHSNINGIAPKTLRAWWAASRQMDATFYQNPINRARFLGFFQAASGLTHVLRFLNLYGVLARYLPEWHKIVGLLQHDLFHIYPVDDHILMVLNNVRRLALEEYSHELPAASTLMHGFAKPHMLYLAALFHDIAKGRNGDHAELGVADALRFAHDHQLSADDADLLAWLVREHLLMSQTAQKEDINDPEVVQRFCERVGNQEKLTALYLLTIADMRGTNPKIWNSWKAQLLESLFQAASAQLSGSLKNENDIAARYRHAQECLTSLGYEARDIRRLFNALGEAYFSRHSTPTIVRQLPQIAAHPEQATALVQTMEDSHNLRALVYMPNRDRLFTRLCRLFSQHQLNIAAARAFVTAHDFILDNFIITLPEHSNEDDRKRIQTVLQTALQRFVQGDIPKFPASKAQASRRARLLPIAPIIRIQPDDEHKARYTIEVIAANRPYLLADLTEVFARHNIRLHYAKIATLDERAEDSFLVECADLNHATKQLTVQKELLAAIG
ncbi:[protein-PII] uridylyltransferase [Wielerella bovis]|uniref:[protein-PII] uridylyltransferase n=1 Tax=Wielerella bovis TaxID=2917790 RepID=UPI002019554B|nr:[protein-PII] uridylyltransferase [Wielerella bovis]MCG7657666.1 [protein-PII] uridylyltransferase [Wielerella bovis]MCG7659887.1 [protein-PII] uridylyltransferase [Wielerella bovis]